MIDVAIHVAVVLLLPPLLLGVIGRTKAFFAGRRGPPLLQPYRDVWKLLRKQAVLSRTTTWIFVAGPAVSLVTAFAAALIIPLGGHAAPLGFEGDFILFAYLLGLGRFATILAALDTGSSFEGMGGAREATFSLLAEPALFFGLVVLARAAGSLSLEQMLGAGIAAAWVSSGAGLAAVLGAFFIVLLVENSRVPFDDPATHLELTMVHEVMVLDHGGPPFGLVLWGSALKLFVFGALVAGVATPVGLVDRWIAWPVFAGVMILLAVTVGIVESVMARLRLLQVPNLLVAACLMAAFGAVLLVR